MKGSLIWGSFKLAVFSLIDLVICGKMAAEQRRGRVIIRSVLRSAVRIGIA